MTNQCLPRRSRHVIQGEKATVYEGGHRVPFFIHWPAGNMWHGGDVADLTAHFDVLPTLIDLCGLTPPKEADFDGRSFKRQLFDPLLKALPVVAIRLKVGDHENVKRVKPGDTKIPFSAGLDKADYEVKAEMLNDRQKLIADAYYVYCRKV